MAVDDAAIPKRKMVNLAHFGGFQTTQLRF
jgi:hypothetical protein